MPETPLDEGRDQHQSRKRRRRANSAKVLYESDHSASPRRMFNARFKDSTIYRGSRGGGGERFPDNDAPPRRHLYLSQLVARMGVAPNG